MTTFDVEKALDQIEGDRETLAVLVSTFRRVSPAQLEEMGRAVQEEDAEKLAAVAHCFKGSLGLFAAETASGMARQLELHAREADFGGASQTLAALQTECRRLEHDLTEYLQSTDEHHDNLPR